MKRSARSRLLIGGTGAAVAAVIVATTLSTAAADPAESGQSQLDVPEACEIERLPAPDPEMNHGRADSISPNGEYISMHLRMDSDRQEFRAALWHDDEAEVLDTPGERAEVRGVADSGSAAGWSWEDGGSSSETPWVYHDETMSTIPGVDHGRALDVNVHGDAVGWRDVNRPFVWPNGADEVVSLSLPDEASGGRAYGINDDGIIVGAWEDETAYEHPYAWDADGEGIELPLPDDFDPEKPLAAERIVGDWAIAHDGPPIRWDMSDGGAVERVDTDMGGRGINSQGWIAGAMDDWPAILVDDEVIELPVLGDGTEFGVAYGLSDAGDLVVGTDFDPEIEETVPVLWRCE